MATIDKCEVKAICTRHDAELLVGVTTPDRFEDAPEGFRPTNVLATCRSVLVLCCEFPIDSADCDFQTYTIVRQNRIDKMDQLAADIAEDIEKLGFDAKPVQSISSSLSEDGRYRGPISLKHAAVQAGLGKIGKNTLLVNDKYGNMIWLSAVLTSIPLSSDLLADYEVCEESCTLCVDHCPVSALDDTLIKQLTCYHHAFKTIDGKLEMQCWKCRQICPNSFGVRTSFSPPKGK